MQFKLEGFVFALVVVSMWERQTHYGNVSETVLPCSRARASEESGKRGRSEADPDITVL